MSRIIAIGALLCVALPGFSQVTKQLTTDDFEKMSKSWSEVSDIRLDPVSDTYQVEDGEGVLVNLPGKKKGEDIRTKEEFGDIDLSLEYMMFPGSNSGIYLHGRYEVQLLDSWRKVNVSSADNGGIYKRFSEEENRDVDGYPPRQNASRAPGLWQSMQISFRAPRFDDAGNKIENARILKVVLNGVEVHDDVELYGSTGGAWGAEAAMGPLRIQGDHGAVAFRNMTITTFDNPVPVMSGITYKVYEGTFNEMPNFDELTPIAEGETDVLTPSVSPINNAYLIRFTGNLDVKTAGTYNFEGHFNGGGGTVMIDGKPAIPVTEWRGNGSMDLEAGVHQVDLFYGKVYEWAAAGLRFMVNGPGIRNVSFHDENVNMITGVDPIYLDAPTMLRSFMDVPGGHRITRAVSVGSPSGVHYTYDMDHGSLVHAWRGEFIDATPMWNNRGDGSSRPRGSITSIDGIDLIVRSGDQKVSDSDTVNTNFRPRGYTMVNNGVPQFMYDVNGHRVTDLINVLPDASGFNRKITVHDTNDLYVRLGKGSSIEEVQDGLLRVDGYYYIKYDPAMKPEVISEGDSQSVWVNVNDELSYEILF